MGRLYYLDAMRSILMMLGIVLHAAVIFSEGSWLVKTEQTSSTYNAIVDFIHFFRMPAFFIVSGFFCHMTLNRYGSRLFLKVRMPRIFIPLAVTALTLNSIQSWVLSDYRQLSMELYSLDYWLQGIWVSHLWFLVSLLYYFALFAVCFFFAKPILNKLLEWGAKLYLKTGIISLFLLALLSVVFIKASYLIGGLVFADGFDWVIAESISYAIFFLFGYMAGSQRQVLETFTQYSLPLLAFTLVGVVASYGLQTIYQGSLSNTLVLYSQSLLTWLLCYLCFILFKHFTNKASSLFSYFSEASYSIYLFHHILVIIYAILIYQLNIPVWLMFLLLMIVTFFSTVLIHHYMIRNISIMKYLFNGKR